MERVGICGSDIHIYRGLSPRTRPPLVLGHEFAGRIHSLGAGVHNFQVGDRVTAEPGIGCGVCTYCRSGRYNLCPDLYAIGSRRHDGAYADYVRAPASKLLHLPPEVSLADAAVTELAACAVHAGRIGKIESGAVVLVIGAGPLGILLAQAAKMAGADAVAVADLVPPRLARACQCGADAVVNTADEDLVAWTVRTYGEGGVACVFDTASTPDTFDLAFRSVRRGGRIVNVGVHTKQVTWQPNILMLTEVELTGTNMYADGDFAAALQAMQTGRLRVGPLITGAYPLSQIEEAFAAVRGDPNRCKVLLAPPLG